MYAAGGTRRWLDLATVVVVVAIFCFLAALPRRVHDAQEAALRYNLRSLRVAIELFKVQHDGLYPAIRTRTSQEFHDQMLRPSNRLGETAPLPTRGYTLGPYFAGELPPNPLSGARGVLVVDDADAEPPDKDSRVWVGGRTQPAGWIYSPLDGHVKPNSPGTNLDGLPWQEH